MNEMGRLGSRLSEDFNKLDPEKQIKIVRTLDTTVEFQISNQPLKINSNNEYPNKITKTVRVILPNSKKVDFKKYQGILESLIGQAQEIAVKKGRDLDVQDLKSVGLKGKNTGLRWKLVDTNKTFFGNLLRFLHRIGIFKMFNVKQNQGVINLVLKESSPWYTKIFGISTKRQIAIKAFKGIPNLPKVPYKKEDKEMFAGFKDPFTKVASYAFQYLEPDFGGRDNAKIDELSSEYEFIMDGDNLTLAHKDDFVIDKKEKAAAALKEFKAYFFAEHSPEKRDYLTHMARIDFSKLTKLTPEHVYRLNVLACNTEAQDIRSLVYKMQEVKNQLDDSDEPLSFSEIDTDFLSQSEKRSMVAWARLDLELSSDDVLTSSDFIRAVETLGFDESHSYADFIKAPIEEELDQKEVTNLIQAITPTVEERKRSYTGREILYPINTTYTIADRKIYKPWVDQQEVSQIFDLLEEDFRYDPYDDKNVPLTQEQKDRRLTERASILLSKKHLFRPHPTEGLRVGALIPAPSDHDNNKRWYRVESMASNQQGLLFYVLEPVGKGSDLETMILARSTASDQYAYQGAATVRNDVNQLNAPGYEGRRHLVDSALKKARKDHTIPTWVAYQHSARLELDKDELDIRKVHDHLVASKNEIEKDLMANHGVMSLHQIIRLFDSEFNDVMWKNIKNQSFKSRVTRNSERSRYQKLIYHFANDYSKQRIQDEEKVDRIERLKEENVAAKDLIIYIEKYGTRGSEGKLTLKFQEVIDALKINILEPPETKLKKEIILNENLSEELKEAFELIDTSPNELASLKAAERLLRQYAKSIGEDVGSKKTNGILLTGHSLGGSSAEVEAYSLTAGSNRVPVPGTRMRVALYDDPGMNEEDNTDMHEFLFVHREMMKNLYIDFDVYHSYDYGDVVAMGAPAHLGGSSSKIEERLLKRYKKQIKYNEEFVTLELINWFKKRHPAQGELVDLDKLREFRQKMPLKNEDWKQYFDFHRQSGFAYLTPLELISSGKNGKKEVLKFIRDQIQRNMRVRTEIKVNTNHTLEQETSSVTFKHGTRFEMTREEKELLFNIASKTKEQIQKKNKEIVNFRTLGNFIRESYSSKEPAKSEVFLKDFDCFELLKRKIRDKKTISDADLQNFNLLFPEIYKKSVKEGVVNIKALSLIEKSIKKKHQDLLKLAFKDYTQLLLNQAQKLQQRVTGGARITHINPKTLGGLGGKGDLSSKEVCKIWGGGWIDSRRMQKIGNFLGMVGPNIFGSIAKIDKEESFESQGFGNIRDYQNPKNGALNIEL